MTVSFSPLTPRWCAWCQQPLQGRSDKLFCKAACRRIASRHGVVGGAPIDWQARALQAEQAQHALQAQLDELQQAKQAAAPFEQRYHELSQVLGVLAAELGSRSTVANLLDFVTQLLDYYHQHPGLPSGEEGAQQRLQHLQQLHTTLLRHYTDLQAT